MREYILKISVILVSVFFVFNAFAAGEVGSAFQEPKLVGDIALQGDLGWSSSNYNLSKKYSGVLLAHSLCNENFEGSRAALYDDFKYIYKDLSVTKDYWVLDFVSSRMENTLLFKNGKINSSNSLSEVTCSAWGATTNQGSALDVSSSDVILKSCSSTNYIACVED